MILLEGSLSTSTVHGISERLTLRVVARMGNAGKKLAWDEPAVHARLRNDVPKGQKNIALGLGSRVLFESPELLADHCYPGWTAPCNACLGSLCLLRDHELG